MKKMKQYGVTQPKSLDYLLAGLFALVSISALWIGIWIAATHTQSLAAEVLNLTVRALSGKFAGSGQWIVAVESLFIYGGALVSVLLCVLVILSKRYSAFAGVFAVLLSAFAIALEIGFVAGYFNSGISGLFLVFLVLFVLLQLLALYYVAKLLYSMLVKESEAYARYKSEFPDGDNVRIIEVEVPAEGEPVEEPTEVEAQDEVEYVEKESEAIEEVEEAEEEELAVEPIEEESAEAPEEEKDSRFGGADANKFTFEQKLRRAKPVARQYFKELKQYFESLGFTAELTKQAETFSHKKVKYAMITMAGQNGLRIYYKLDAKDYEDSTIPVKSVAEVKKYEKTPLMFIAKSDLSVKRAKMLMDDLKKKYIGEEELVVKEEPKAPVKKAKEEKPKVKSEKKLAKKKEVKKPATKKSESKKADKKAEPKAKVEKKATAKKSTPKAAKPAKKEEAKKAPVKKEAPKAEPKPAEKNAFGGEGNNYTFEEKLNLAQPVVRKQFKDLTRYFVEKGFTPSVTKESESFYYKNVKYAMITMAGQKGLKVYYKLDSKDYIDSPIPVKSVAGVKKYERTPLLLVAKSDLAIKRAKKLVDDVRAKIE